MHYVIDISIYTLGHSLSSIYLFIVDWSSKMEGWTFDFIIGTVSNGWGKCRPFRLGDCYHQSANISIIVWALSREPWQRIRLVSYKRCSGTALPFLLSRGGTYCHNERKKGLKTHHLVCFDAVAKAILALCPTNTVNTWSFMRSVTPSYLQVLYAQ